MLKRLQQLSSARFETPMILKQLNSASRSLAELKGVIAAVPNQRVLINTLGIQEAKDSSAIENIVTTHDELYRQDAFLETFQGASAKEVHRYREALTLGFGMVRESGLLTINHLNSIQADLLESSAGIRTLPGTALRNSRNQVIYTPPQDHEDILVLYRELEKFINDPSEFDADPLVKMALIHHQFESIHPYYDGNGRTGRILNVLYLVKESLLDIPVLYLSRPLVKTKDEYYRLLTAVREADEWEAWVLYMLQAVETSAKDAIITVNEICDELLETKHMIRQIHPSFYSQDLINHLFSHPYTKIEFVMSSLGVSRLTASRYLDALSVDRILSKHKIGRSNYYINVALWKILAGERMQSETD